MNKQKFVEYLKQPTDLTSQDLETLEDVLSAHPYFQNARFLVAKGAKIKGSPDHKEKIATAAVYANDRQLLKKYINDQLIFLRTPKALESEHNTVPKPVLEEKEVARTIEEPATETPTTQTESIQGKETETTDYSTELVKNTEPLSDLDHLIDDLWHDVEELRKSKARFFEIEKKIEEEEAVDEAVKRATKANEIKSKFFKAEKSKEEDKTVKRASEKAAEKKTVTPEPVEVKPDPVEIKKEVIKEVPAKKVEVKKDEPAPTKKKAPVKSSTAAKKTTVKKDAPSISSAPKSSKAKKAPEAVVGAPLETKIPSPAKTTIAKPESDKKETKVPKATQTDLIDNFIRTNPSMPTGEQIGDNNSGDLSGTSAEFHPEIASEYLAEIFLEQGKKERAIEIYKTLSLKFPEKKSFFATLIKKLN